MKINTNTTTVYRKLYTSHIKNMYKSAAHFPGLYRAIFFVVSPLYFAIVGRNEPNVGTNTVWCQ